MTSTITSPAQKCRPITSNNFEDDSSSGDEFDNSKNGFDELHKLRKDVKNIGAAERSTNGINDDDDDCIIIDQKPDIIVIDDEMTTLEDGEIRDEVSFQAQNIQNIILIIIIISYRQKKLLKK